MPVCPGALGFPEFGRAHLSFFVRREHIPPPLVFQLVVHSAGSPPLSRLIYERRLRTGFAALQSSLTRSGGISDGPVALLSLLLPRAVWWYSVSTVMITSPNQIAGADAFEPREFSGAAWSDFISESAAQLFR